MTCNTCHTDAGNVPGCVNCHDQAYWGVDVNNDPLTARDVHHAISVNLSASCNTCHTQMSFDSRCDSCHSSGDASLQAHHNRIKAPVSCGFCHGASADIPATDSCVFCHDSQYWGSKAGGTAMGQHHDVILGSGSITDCVDCHDTLVAQTCATCHNNGFWSSAGRIGSAEAQHHDVVRLASSLACADCHSGGLPGENNNCQACHDGATAPFHHESVAQGLNCQECHTESPVIDNCVSCHTSTSWVTDARSDHHATPTYTASVTSGDCSSCHNGQVLGQDCASCHTTWATDARTVHHDTASANGTSCNTCHQSVAPASGCRSCHGDDWQPDPLTGVTPPNKHHTNTSYGFDCLDCHRYNPDWSLALPVEADCEVCHVDFVNNATVPQFHHATPGYAANNCASCHSGIGGIDPQSLDCATCHASQPGLNGSPAMHHSTTRVNTNVCSNCHTGITQASLDCASCHSNQTAVAGLDGTPGMHHGTADGNPNYAAGNCATCHTNVAAQDCASCHIAEGKTPIPERHHTTTKVDATDCNQCHTGASVVVNDCEACHGGTASQQAARHHATPTYAVNNNDNCVACHEGISEVSGNALDCATCHAGTTKTGDPAMHHGTADGSPDYASGNCETCHDVLNFSQLMAANDCEDCHTNGNPEILGARHHSTAPARAENCSACHNIDQAELGCATCHARQSVKDGKALMHHATATASSGSCTDCHASVVVTNVTCRTCHASQPVFNGGLEMHHNTTLATGGNCMACHVGADSALMDCAGCHVDPNNPAPISDRHHNSQFAQTAKCTDCHTAVNTAELNCELCHARQPVAVSGSLTMHHEMTVSGTMGQCASCHANAEIVESDCGTCHTSGNRPPIVDTHHATETYQLGDCSVCHVGAEAQGITCANCHTPGDHHLNSNQYAQDNCSFCHTGITLNGSNCEACHGGGAATIPELHHATPLTNVGGDCSVCHAAVSTPDVCANCHTSVPHHNTMAADYGLCESCHTWPSDKNENPQQASCRQCHGQYMHGKNSAAPIHDYRACFDCHGSGGSMGAYYPLAAVPSVFHARPNQGVGLTGTAPGKGTFNLFYSSIGGQSRNEDRFSEAPQWENMNHQQYRDPMISYNRVAVSEAGQTYQVPAFPDIPAPDIGDGGSTGGGSGLTACTSCHGDRSNQVACDNPRWTTHYSSGLVDLATYQLAESTYLGSYCGGTEPPTDPLASCTSCHGDRSNLVDCNNYNWTSHVSSGLVSQSTYDLAETTYLGSTCDGGNTGGGNTVDPSGSYFEAESYSNFGNNFSERSSSSASGGVYLLAETNSTSSTSGSAASYQLNFTESGTYYIWFLGDSNGSSGDNSLWYGVDGSRSGNANFSTSSGYRWTNESYNDGPNPTRISITSAGTHTINIWARENGLRFDGFYLSKSSSASPSTGGSSGGGNDGGSSYGGNLAENKSASASDDEGSEYRASRAVDGSTSSRWYVRSFRTEWLKVDLGSRYTISQVVVNWHNYYAREYDVEVSNDNSNWTRVYRNENGNGGIDTVNFNAREARYVRIVCNRGNDRGYSVYELEVYQ